MTPLRQRMIEDMQVRNLAAKTQHSYLYEVSRFARHFGASPDLLGPAEIRAYCLYLVHDRQLSAGSIKVAFGAIRFLYKVSLERGWNFEDDIPAYRAPKQLRIVLSQQEVRQFLDAVRNLKHCGILTTCYAAGLRVSEAVHLKPTAIDSQRMVIRVEHRPKLWLFPGTQPGQPTSHLITVEWACRAARERSGLTKPVTPHSLRHAFAVHLLEGGADLRTIQLLLGHSSLRITAPYLRIATNKVCATTSPLDGLSCLPAIPPDALPA